MLRSADSAIREPLATGLTKLESTLGPASRLRLRKLRSEVHVATSAQRPQGPLGRLAEALDSRGFRLARSSFSAAWSPALRAALIRASRPLNWLWSRPA